MALLLMGYNKVNMKKKWYAIIYYKINPRFDWLCSSLYMYDLVLAYNLDYALLRFREQHIGENIEIKEVRC